MPAELPDEVATSPPDSTVMAAPMPVASMALEFEELAVTRPMSPTVISASFPISMAVVPSPEVWMGRFDPAATSMVASSSSRTAPSPITERPPAGA